jgi:ribosomal protein S13
MKLKVNNATEAKIIKLVKQSAKESLHVTHIRRLRHSKLSKMIVIVMYKSLRHSHLLGVTTMDYNKAIKRLISRIAYPVG